MTTISFTFKLISPRKANSSYLWAHGRWWHTRSRGRGGCRAGGASSCGIKLVLTLQCKWSSQPGSAVLMTNQSQLLAHQGTWAEGKTETHQNGQSVALPPYPNHPTPSVTSTFLKQILVGTGSTDCPGNGGSKAAGNIPLQMGRRTQGRALQSSNDPRWNHFLEMETGPSVKIS